MRAAWVLGAAAALHACGGDAAAPPVAPLANRAPVAVGTIPVQTVAVGDTASVDLGGYFNDPDGQALTYAAATSDVAVAVAAVAESVLRVVGAGQGAATVTVTARDPGGLTAQQSVGVTVPNRAPVVVGDIPAQVVAAGDTVTVDVAEYFIDPDGDALAFRAGTSDSAVAAAFTKGDSLTVLGFARGTATLTVTAQDPTGSSANQDMAVTVPNQPPVLTDSIPALEIAVGSRRTIRLSDHFADPDGDTLRFRAETSDSRVVSVLADHDTLAMHRVAAGAVRVIVTATDPHGLFVQQDFPVTAPLTERDVLVEFFNATGGPNWTRKDNWVSDMPLDRWWGVSVDSEGRVVGLKLELNGLTGSIPPEVGRLSELKTLSLKINSLTGSIPDALGDLPRLQLLNLANNDLTGVIPPGLGRLAQLRMLILSINRLSGTIPPELGMLRQLRDLALAYNRLSGPIPPQLGNLILLERLNLGGDWRGNTLTGSIPAELGSLGNLRYLDITNNQLTGPVPTELGNLSALRSLSLFGNAITGSIPLELGRLTNLVAVGLSNNELSGSIPPELANLSDLRSLSLRRNNLTGSIPSGLGRLDLFDLNLADNQLSGEIPAELGSFAHLGTLDLSNNLLTGKVPRELGNIRIKAGRWGDIRLNDNQLTGTIPASLGAVDSLSVLDLSNNRLSGEVPAEIGNLERLWVLLLDNNTELAGPLPTTLVDIKQLRLLGTTDTGLCAPSDEAFEAWLRTVIVHRLARCAGGAARAYLTQAVQSREHPVTLVAGEDALLRVFVTAERTNGFQLPPVRATFFVDGVQVHVAEIPAGVHGIPTQVEEGKLAASANANVPGAVVQPGLEMVVEVDPTGTLDPALGAAERIPKEGRRAIAVQAPPRLDLTVVPFVLADAADSTSVQAVRGMVADPYGHELLSHVRELLPVSAMMIDGHEVVVTNDSDAYALWRVTTLMRAMEGGTGYYIGLMGGMTGVVGEAFGGNFATGVAHPEGGSIAHTLGHNFGLRHASCGDAWPGGTFGFDERYPYPGGSIGAWGYSAATGELVPPSAYDLMSYGCGSLWISDYHFGKAFRFRMRDEANLLGRPTAGSAETLVLWGGTDAAGSAYLDPGLVAEMPPSLPPPGGGGYKLVGVDSDGAQVFGLEFEMAEAVDGHGFFLFAVPIEPGWPDELESIVLTGPGGTAVLDGATDRPITVYRDRVTGQVRGVLWGAEFEDDAAAAGLPGTFDVLTSRGVPELTARPRRGSGTGGQGR